MQEILNSNKSFAVESTLSGNNIIKIIEKAKQKNYRIVLVYSFLQNCATCIARVKNRVKNGGHDVPEADIVRRYCKSITKFGINIDLCQMSGHCFIMDTIMRQ